MNILDNRRIAKNTVLLYVRMLLSIVVTLYTSRVVLRTLGVDDFGIYGIVGGVVAMFSFLNASMSGATSRYITFSLGYGDNKNVIDTFSTALIIHIVIAACIVLLSETVGLWFLEKKLVIPEGRMVAARIVYQCSIIAMAVQVIQVPYNAMIISYERMDIYAYIELLNVFLKLGIIYLLKVGCIDKLVLYALLVLIVNIIIALTYRMYCKRNFAACKFHFIIDKKILLPMISFSGWDLYGNMCYTARHQGVNMLINMFFGVALNAATSIASSVQGVVSSLSANVVQAFRPQIIKLYAQNRITEMELLMCNSIKFSILLFAVLGVPLSYEVFPIMKLWLGQVPEYAPQFCVLLMATSLFNLINSVIVIVIHATGRIKALSLVSGTIYLLTIPVVYILFKYIKADPIQAYVVFGVIMLMVLVVNIIIAKVQVSELSVNRILYNIVLAISLAGLAMPGLLVANFFENTILHVIISFSSYILILAILVYVFVLDKEMKHKIHSYLQKK